MVVLTESNMVSAVGAIVDVATIVLVLESSIIFKVVAVIVVVVVPAVVVGVGVDLKQQHTRSFSNTHSGP